MALEAAKRLIGQWPHAKPADPEMYAASLAAVLAQYPLGLVEECCDPRTGHARSRELPPTMASVVAWCDGRLDWHQKMATYKPSPPSLPAPEFSDEHRMTMLARLSKLMHEIFERKDEKWARPVGPFETRGDFWNPHGRRRNEAASAEGTPK